MPAPRRCAMGHVYQLQGARADRQTGPRSWPESIAYWRPAVYHDSFGRRVWSMRPKAAARRPGNCSCT
jgi:hypothetical protein